MRPIPAPRLGDAHGLIRAIEQRGRLRTDEFVTEFKVEELFPPGLENALGRMRHFISYARSAGLVKEDRGVVELTDIGRRYIRSGDPDAFYDISSQQAEWLRRQLREKHMTDSIFHGLSIGLSLLTSVPPGVNVATLDFGRSMAYLGRAGWDNENTLQIQGERHLTLLRDMELIDEDRRVTPAGHELRSELTLPIHMALLDLASQLNPGGADAVRAAAAAEFGGAAAEPEPPAAPSVSEAAPAPAGEEDDDNGYHTAIGLGAATAEPSPPPVVPRPSEPPPGPPYDSPTEISHPAPPPTSVPPPMSATPPPVAAEPPVSTPPPASAGLENAASEATASEAPPADAATAEGAPPPVGPAPDATSSGRPPAAPADAEAAGAAPPPVGPPPAGPPPAVPADAAAAEAAPAPVGPPPAATSSGPPPAEPAHAEAVEAAPPDAGPPAVPADATASAGAPPEEVPADAGDPAGAAAAAGSPPEGVPGEAPVVAASSGVAASPEVAAADVEAVAGPAPADVMPGDLGGGPEVLPEVAPPAAVVPAEVVGSVPPPVPVGARDEFGGEGFVDARAVRAAAEESGLRLPAGVYANAVAGLASGRHLLLTGAPGAGKTTLALAVARAAAQGGRAQGATVVTAGPDVAAAVTEAGRRGRWLVLDELDRVDPDGTLGPLSTFLGGLPVTIAGKEAAPAADWRLVATWSGPLPQASVLRRFAVVEVGGPPAEALRSAIRAAAQGDATAAAAIERLLPLADAAPLGAGVFLAAARHAAERNAVAPADAATLAREAYAAYVAPLLGDAAGDRLRDLLDDRPT